MPDTSAEDLDRDAPVMMLREIASSHRLERTSRVTAKALDEGALPDGLRRLLADYRERHPRQTVKSLTFRTIIDGEIATQMGTEKLPPDEKLVTFSLTETVINSEESRVVGHVLFAQWG